MASATTKAASSSGRCDGLVAAASGDARYVTAAAVVQVVGLFFGPVDDCRSRALRAPATFRLGETEREVL
jgi:hypothetical protein